MYKHTHTLGNNKANSDADGRLCAQCQPVSQYILQSESQSQVQAVNPSWLLNNMCTLLSRS